MLTKKRLILWLLLILAGALCIFLITNHTGKDILNTPLSALQIYKGASYEHVTSALGEPDKVGPLGYTFYWSFPFDSGYLMVEFDLFFVPTYPSAASYAEMNLFSQKICLFGQFPSVCSILSLLLLAAAVTVIPTVIICRKRKAKKQNGPLKPTRVMSTNKRLVLWLLILALSVAVCIRVNTDYTGKDVLNTPLSALQIYKGASYEHVTSALGESDVLFSGVDGYMWVFSDDLASLSVDFAPAVNLLGERYIAAERADLYISPLSQKICLFGQFPSVYSILGLLLLAAAVTLIPIVIIRRRRKAKKAK